MKTQNTGLTIRELTPEERVRVWAALRPGEPLHELFATAMGLRQDDGFVRCRGDASGHACGHGAHEGACRSNLGACACQGTPGYVAPKPETK